MRPAKPVLAGNSQGAIDVLDLLLESYERNDVLVVAPPDETKHSWQPSLGVAARERGVALIQPDKVNEPAVIDQLSARGSDLMLSVYYLQIFKPELLGAIAGPSINFHPSLLPRHRGTAPLVWAIVEGDSVTGVTVHELTPGVDTGPIVDQQALPIHPDDTGFTLHLKATKLVGAMAARLLRRLLAGDGLPPAREQVGEASYHSKRDPNVNHIDWSQPRKRVRNVVRALAPPLPGGYTFVGDQQILIESVTSVDLGGPSRPPGMLEFRKPSGPAVLWAGDGALAIDRCVIEGVSRSGFELLGYGGILDGDMAR